MPTIDYDLGPLDDNSCLRSGLMRVRDLLVGFQEQLDEVVERIRVLEEVVERLVEVENDANPGFRVDEMSAWERENQNWED